MNRKRSSRSRREPSEAGLGHRLQQLCAQAHEVLSLALEGECKDPLLQQLSVRAVFPDPDASRLAVHVSAPEGESAPAILAALDRAKGLLRSQLCAELDKKRTPTLRFVLHAEEAQP